MTCTKTENGLLFSKDGKEVLVEDVSHPHFAKHVAVSFTLADIEVTEEEVFGSVPTRHVDDRYEDDGA